MTKEEIKKLDGKKHVKIFLLSQLGLTRKEIAKEVNTNQGHVYNVIKDYEKNDHKAAAANLLISSDPVATESQ